MSIFSGESVISEAGKEGETPALEIPRECAVKIFKTSLNEFKTRDKYIRDDYRFKDRFSKQVRLRKNAQLCTYITLYFGV